MPYIPLSLKRFVILVTQTEKLDQSPYYAEDQLKRWFLILEEFSNHTKPPGYDDVKAARDFVSHDHCNNHGLIVLLERELPSSVVTIGMKKEVRYIRHEKEHIAFVSKYERIARQMARTLVVRKIVEAGGYIG